MFRIPKIMYVNTDPIITEFHKLAASVIASQAALFRLEELKHTKYYSQKLKNLLNQTIAELIKKEQQQFDKVFEYNSDVVTMISENYAAVHELLLAESLTDYIIIGNIIHAYKKDPKAIEGITRKILK